MSYTTGPWRWTRYGKRDPYLRALMGPGKDDYVLMGVGLNDSTDAVQVEDEDARLIAAAPELLKALTHLLNHAEHECPDSECLDVPRALVSGLLNTENTQSDAGTR